MMTELEVEVCFLSRDAMLTTIPILAEHGFESRTLDWVDPCSAETCWILAKTATELTPSALLDRAAVLVGDRGLVLTAGPVQTDEQLAAV